MVGSLQGNWNDDIVGNVIDEEIDPDKIIDFSKMNQQGVKVLSENNDSRNKNIGDNGGGSVTYSEGSPDRLTDRFRGYCHLIDKQNQNWD